MSVGDPSYTSVKPSSKPFVTQGIVKRVLGDVQSITPDMGCREEI